MRFVRINILLILVNLLSVILISAQQNLDNYSLIRMISKFGLRNELDSTLLLYNRPIRLSLADLKRIDLNNLSDSFDTDYFTNDCPYIDYNTTTTIWIDTIFKQILLLDSSKISLIHNGKSELVLNELKKSTLLNLDKFEVECEKNKTLSYYILSKPIYSFKNEYAIIKLGKNTINKGLSIFTNYIFICKLVNGKWIIEKMDYFEENILIG